NPEDYTNRGRIITPLKDRYGAQIRTHYPRTIEDEIRIMEQERSRFPIEERLLIPPYITEVIAEITALARRSPDINQRSGVSVRVSIANYETVIANATRRAIRLNEEHVVPRVSDLPFIVASFTGKIELETFEEGRETRVLDELTKKALLTVFNKRFHVKELEPVVRLFEAGLALEVGSEATPELLASTVEFVLEGLHLNRRLNRDRMERGFRYRS
ncbi:MAG: magnesium chelatase, partial [Chloroflexota bacterium]|nr:magnesium chelatase [Chloroflexota bacterium]